jgi:hypothetical protein
MAISIQLVESSAYRLRYLLVNGGSPLGGSVTLPNDGGVSPDLRTDLAGDPSGPLRAIVRARLDGLGTVPPGGLTQAQARAALNSDNTASIGNDLVPRAVTTVTPRSGGAVWAVDIGVDGGGDPVVLISSTALPGEAYLDIHARHSIDL